MAGHGAMDPANSPNTTAGTGRRVNKLPIVLGVIIILGFAMIIVQGYFERLNDERSTEEASRPIAEVTTSPADLIAGDASPTEYVAPEVAPEINEEPALDLQPLTVMPQIPTFDPLAEKRKAEALQMREFRFQAAKTALTSAPTVSFPMPGQGQGQNYGSPDGQGYLQGKTPGEVYQAKLQKIRQQLDGAELPGQGAQDSLNKPEQGLANFAGGSSGNDRWTLSNELKAAPSPYVVQAGAVISGIMITGVNSELPGQILGQVGTNVYDSATGNHLLIPQGTRIVGSYDKGISYGQSRVLIAWQRLLFPNGSTLDLGAMPGADLAGYSGFSDQVDNHYFRIFGTAFLLSGITAGIALSDGATASIGDRVTIGSAISQSVGQQLGSATSNILNKSLDIEPTITIRPGYRFNLFAVKDLVFPSAYRF